MPLHTAGDNTQPELLMEMKTTPFPSSSVGNGLSPPSAISWLNDSLMAAPKRSLSDFSLQILNRSAQTRAAPAARKPFELSVSAPE